MPDLRLHIAGDEHPAYGDYYASMLHLVKRLGLEDRVLFDGFQERPWEWYRKIDLFISNSYSEGLQVAPMEAMAAGCYVLSHRWHGAEELLPEDCLYFTDGELMHKVLIFTNGTPSRRRKSAVLTEALAMDRFSAEQPTSALARSCIV
jgi:glycosyltransferase involved in cell wall biosynthesis